MPVSVDDPFLLASFSSTTHQNQQQHAVRCTLEGRRPTQDEDEVESSSLLVAAIQGQGVQLFNTADQKCVLSYSTPPGYSFVGSAQTLCKSSQLRNIYAVVAKGTDVPAKEEGKVVWMWKDESSSPLNVAAAAADSDSAMQEDAVKSSTARKTVHKFERKIHQLFVSPLLPNHVLLTNTDGSISLVTEDLKRVVNTNETVAASAAKSSKKEKKEPKTKTHSINTMWATTYNTSGSWIPSSALARGTLVIMTAVESDAGKAVFTLSYVNEEQRGFSTFGQVEIDAAAGSCGFAFDVQTGQLSFMTAAGQLKIYNFAVSQGNHVITAAETLSLPLSGYAISTSTKGAMVQRVDTVALGDNYLAVAGVHQNDGKAEQTLTIWDVKYGTLQAKQVLPGSFSADKTGCQLTLLPDSVLVMTISTLNNTTVKSDIYLCHFYAEPMSLLGAMGRMKQTAPFLGQAGAVSQIAYTPTPDIAGTVNREEEDRLTDMERQTRAVQAMERQTLESLGSESKTSTAQAFQEVFFNHMELTKKHAEEMKQKVIATVIEKFSEDKKPQKQNKEKDVQAMDVDTAPVVKATESNARPDKPTKTKSKKESKAAKATEKETAKEAKASAKEAAKKAKADEDGSSSESSSDDDDDDDQQEVMVLSSDDEGDDKEREAEEEPDYAVNDDETQRLRSEAHMRALSEWRKIEAEAIKKYVEQRRVALATQKIAVRPELSHHFVTTVVGRCFVSLPNGQPDMSFWPVKVVEYLIENQLVGNGNPGAGQTGIALNLMEREQWSLLELALKKLQDIPEMDMVIMLKQVIGLNKDRASTSALASSLSGVPDVPHFLNLVMAAPKNEIFMQQGLKRLSVDELSVVLDILRGWIGIWEERGGIGHQNQRPDRKQFIGGLPGYGTIVDFVTLIMDVHFPLLILSPHLHQVLQGIQTSIQRETDISNQLEQALRGPLALFDRRHKENVRRLKKATGALNGTGLHGGVAADKRRRRKWEGGEGIPDYAVEIIHL